MNAKSYFLFSLVLYLLTACNQTPAQEDVVLETVFPDLKFEQAIELLPAPGEADNIYVVSQKGYIEVFNKSESNPSKSTFLDIQDRVQSGGERGLLGMAFHPNYANNGYFYLYYTRSSGGLQSVLARYQMVNQTVDKNKEEILLVFSQPFNNHNAGKIAFGPDGYLYIATGDGGSGGDPQNNAQNRSNLLGKILRIDVDQQADGLAYAIPSDNPYQSNGEGFREEIYAYGLRNPWKFSFDSETGEAWIGDVGQNAFEEIDILEKGANYGWRIREGDNCYTPSSGCASEGLTPPIWEYSQDNGDRSITGGFVYRSQAESSLYGKYLYADYVSGRIWALQRNESGGLENQMLFDTDFLISAFGEDADRNVYILPYGSSVSLRKLSDAAISTSVELPSRASIKIFPNPSADHVNIELSPSMRAKKTQIRLFSAQGKRLKQWKRLSQEEVIRLDLSNLEKGRYFIEIRGESFQYRYPIQR